MQTTRIGVSRSRRQSEAGKGKAGGAVVAQLKRDVAEAERKQQDLLEQLVLAEHRATTADALVERMRGELATSRSLADKYAKLNALLGAEVDRANHVHDLDEFGGEAGSGAISTATTVQQWMDEQASSSDGGTAADTRVRVLREKMSKLRERNEALERAQNDQVECLELAGVEVQTLTARIGELEAQLEQRGEDVRAADESSAMVMEESTAMSERIRALEASLLGEHAAKEDLEGALARVQADDRTEELQRKVDALTAELAAARDVSTAAAARDVSTAAVAGDENDRRLIQLLEERNAELEEALVEEQRVKVTLRTQLAEAENARYEASRADDGGEDDNRELQSLRRRVTELEAQLALAKVDRAQLTELRTEAEALRKQQQAASGDAAVQAAAERAAASLHTEQLQASVERERASAAAEREASARAVAEAERRAAGHEETIRRRDEHIQALTARLAEATPAAEVAELRALPVELERVRTTESVLRGELEQARTRELAMREDLRVLADEVVRLEAVEREAAREQSASAAAEEDRASLAERLRAVESELDATTDRMLQLTVQNDKLRAEVALTIGEQEKRRVEAVASVEARLADADERLLTARLAAENAQRELHFYRESPEIVSRKQHEETVSKLEAQIRDLRMAVIFHSKGHQVTGR